MKKILIVDDEILVRKALLRYFSSLGHTVFEAEEANTAETLWKEYHPDYAFIDILMPERTGPDLLNQIDPLLLNSTQVYLMSALKPDENIIKNLPIKGFLTKPFENLFSLKDLIK